uniref:Uncharacterized protein n=1 Tax=Trichogramma kaykai TaxID=54128 RepID=A0ABD2X4V4_9HYME
MNFQFSRRQICRRERERQKKVLYTPANRSHVFPHERMFQYRSRYSVAVARDLLRRRLRYQHRARAHEQAAEIQRESRSAAGVGRKRWLDTTLTYLHGAANLQSRFMVFMLIILPFGTGNIRGAATYCAVDAHAYASYTYHTRNTIGCVAPSHTTADQPAAPPPAAISMPGGTQAAFAPREQIWPIVVSLVKQAANDHHLRMSDCSASHRLHIIKF